MLFTAHRRPVETYNLYSKHYRNVNCVEVYPKELQRILSARPTACYSERAHLLRVMLASVDDSWLMHQTGGGREETKGGGEEKGEVRRSETPPPAYCSRSDKRPRPAPSPPSVVASVGALAQPPEHVFPLVVDPSVGAPLDRDPLVASVAPLPVPTALQPDTSTRTATFLLSSEPPGGKTIPQDAVVRFEETCVCV